MAPEPKSNPPAPDAPSVPVDVVEPAVAAPPAPDAMTRTEPRTAKRRLNDGPTGRARRAADRFDVI